MNILPQRKTIRLQHYNYHQNSLYFITICINEKKCLFGKIIDNEVILNDAGNMIKKWYQNIEDKFKDIFCLDFIIMPNHIHFILHIDSPNDKTDSNIIAIVQWFKIMTTNEYIKNVKKNNWQPFNKKLWQRSFYEHIIRNEESYHT
ncbi:Transposase and inactivated derivatives [Phocoenobacter uteri]|uniref:Transposase and inactivated derivatives n=1 Tax=Phocoenobacter uteri TaxID=146806 RepID=A0A379CBK1_9PAST|nr:transposase [Phocoenobacter uteri]SUB59661.1 Transposase and inactivated derivatives [Phocoenobacter uteri]